VRQFVFISTIGADEESLVPVLRAKAGAEAYLHASGLSYTILAANGILDVLLPLLVEEPLRRQRPVTVVGEGRRRHSWIAGRDIAAFAVAVAGHPEALNRRLIIGGPTAISWRDVVAAYEQALGGSIPVRSIAPGEMLPDLPSAPELAETLSRLLAVMETYDSPIEMNEMARAFSVRLTPLETFVRGQAISA
jgi:NADH dehydrogenase